MLADAPDERGVLHGQAVRELHQHLGAPGLRGVHRAGCPVHRLAGCDQLAGVRLVERSRVGQPAVDLLVALEIRDRRLVGDRDQDHLAAFLAPSDCEDLHTRRCAGKRPHVADDVLRVGEMPVGPGDVAQELLRGRDRGRGAQVVDHLGREIGPGRELTDLPGVVRVPFGVGLDGLDADRPRSGGRCHGGDRLRCRGVERGRQ